eukprot:SAG22_NODE_140_length_17982_cov_81.438741_8_plen_113_part_00
MTTFQTCAYDWSRYAADAPAAVRLNATALACPASCVSGDYDWRALVCNGGDGLLKAPPTSYRPPRAGGEASFCEWFSTIYDVGIGLILTAVTVGFAFSVNSYRQTAEEKSSG